MGSGTYSKSEPLRAKPRPLSGAGTPEIAILVGAVAVGVGVGLVLDSLVLGFAALLALALIARILLAVLGDGPSKGPHAHQHEQARP
jgi:hypothetical protein